MEDFQTHSQTLRSRDFSARSVAARVDQDEWRLLITARPNVLLEGAQETTNQIVDEAMDWLPTPHATWSGVPPSGDRPATLVVRSIAALDRDQQSVLFEWLEAQGNRVQVISTTTEPLYPMVGRGAFLANLYYRLNVLRLEVARARASNSR